MLIIWNIPLVLLSVLVAMIGSFTALTHAQRMRESSGRSAWIWMTAGGITLGLAIWSMHFIGMLAFHLPVPVSYDLTLTLLSVFPAIAAALLVFYVLHAPGISNLRIVASGLVMGAGISIMHYIGMAALKMSPQISYDPLIFTLSIVIAIIASWGALLMMYQGERIKIPALPRFALSSVLMSLAISGMHYTAILGANIQPDSMCLAGVARVAPDILAMMVSLVSLLWFGGGILAVLYDQRMARRNAQALAQIKQAHRQVLRDLAYQKHALDQHSIVAITDLRGTITYVNDKFCAISQYSRDESLGQNHRLLNSGTHPKEFFHDMYLSIASGKVWHGEICNRAKDGHLYWVDTTIVPNMDSDGKPFQYVAIRTDITERKRLDHILQDKNAELENAKVVAEKANLAKSDFLSGMSHELRTPLHAILGFSQLLEASSPLPTSAQLDKLQHITKAGWYLLELINEILDLAVIESGRVSLSREPVALTGVMLECQDMIEPLALQHGIKLTFLPFDNSWFANADRTRVKQVLINLLSNAVKYNREHGTVEVTCSEISPARIRISIKDSGAGLPSEKLAQLFQPFNRLGQESSSVEGTGIGLVVTKKLIELMGGTIGVESTVGAGSEFWIELIRDVTPHLSVENTMSAEPAMPLQGNAKQYTMLYVEDNPANLILVEKIIEIRSNIRMLSALDGNLGIALARAHLPDVILMDINLPGISGIEALKILRSNPLTAHIPVVALSANAMLRDIETGMEAGFFRYLTKPIKINEFMNVLDEALKFADNWHQSE